MNRELVLHIGSHKTGTTTIQHALASNYDALARQGARYVWKGKYPNLHEFLVESDAFGIHGLGMRVRDMDGLKRLFDSARGTSKVIASSENFSFFFEHEAIANLAQMIMNQFDAVRVVVYLRRQDSHAISHHQEGAKPDRTQEEILFGSAARALPDSPNMVHYLDYCKRIGNWLDAFGKANVDVRVFDRTMLIDGDVWPDFIAAAGLTKVELIKPRDENKSWGLTETKVSRILKSAGYKDDSILKIVSSLPKDAPQLPGRLEAEAFYQTYRAGNAELARLLGRAEPLFPEDFSGYADSPNEEWTEESVAGLVESFAMMCIDSDFGALSAVELRDAALLARQAGCRDLSLALTNGARARNLDGPVIRGLLAELTDPSTQALQTSEANFETVGEAANSVREESDSPLLKPRDIFSCFKTYFAGFFYRKKRLARIDFLVIGILALCMHYIYLIAKHP